MDGPERTALAKRILPSRPAFIGGARSGPPPAQLVVAFGQRGGRYGEMQLTAEVTLMRLLSRSLPLLVLTALASAAPSPAENLLVNAGFDSDLAGWSLLDPLVEAVWSPEDVAGDPASGSARVTHPGPPGPGGSGPAQCVPVVGGARYDFGAFIREPSGHSGSGVAYVLVHFFAGGACEGTELGGAGADPIEEVEGEWFPVQNFVAQAPEAAGSARVLLLVASDQHTARFDDVRFCPHGTCGLLHPDQESLRGAEFPGYQFRVVIEAGGEARAGVQEEVCLAETLCASGALPGRVEAQLRVTGPRPNGFHWFQVVRFTPSRMVIEAVHFATGTVHYYVLPAVRPGDRPTNIEDRRAFLP